MNTPEATPIAGIYSTVINGSTFYFAELVIDGKHYRSTEYEAFENALKALQRIWERALNNHK